MSDQNSRNCSVRRDKQYPKKQGFTLAITLFLLLSLISSNALAASHSNSVKGSLNKMLSLVGPKHYYLALGDSLAFGFQPNLNFDNGYTDDFFKELKSQGVKDITNLGCFGESSFTFINYGCPVPFLHKYPYIGPQLTAALDYLHHHLAQVSPVTLDLGVNDFVFDFNRMTCTVNSHFQSDLQTLDTNLTQIILPELRAALTVNGQVAGDLIMMNYYDPFQNQCPNTVSYFQILNQHLTNDVRGFGIIVDVFTAFGGPKVPNDKICAYTWMCSIYNDYHPTNEGYNVIAATFERATGY